MSTSEGSPSAAEQSTGAGFVRTDLPSKLPKAKAAMTQGGEVMDLLMKPTLNVYPEFASVLGIGKNAAYALAHSGRVRVLRVGRHLRVPSSAVRELLGES